jgi:hypothetical protein
MHDKKILICGGGNGAHAAAAIIKDRFPSYQVALYLSIAYEFEIFKRSLKEKIPIKVKTKNRTFAVWIDSIINNPKDAVLDSDLILLILPSFAHEITLDAITPYLKDETIIGVIPSRGGLEFSQTERLIRFNKKNVFFGLQTLPWACRIREYASSVDILGKKKSVGLASLPRSYGRDLSKELSLLFDIHIYPLNNMIELTLGNQGQIVHPGMMYGMFSSNESVKYKKNDIPLFYHSINNKTADLLTRMSNEVLCIADKIAKHIPTKNVIHLKDWIIASYKDDIRDTSSLKKAFQTNNAYNGLKVPVKEESEGFMVPDFMSRYVSEDVPYGLVVTRGIADIAGVRTPKIDMVIRKLSEWLNKEYIVDDKLEGHDIKDVRIPQNYGLNSIEAIKGVVLQ